jgi:hypothetical protein
MTKMLVSSRKPVPKGQLQTSELSSIPLGRRQRTQGYGNTSRNPTTKTLNFNVVRTSRPLIEAIAMIYKIPSQGVYLSPGIINH